MNKSSLGPVGNSLVIHLLLVALFLVGFTVVHRVEHQRHSEQLIFTVPAQPQPKLTRMVKTPVSTQPAAPLTVAHLAIDAPSTMRATRVEEQQPRLVALSNPAPLELPLSTLSVSEAPQVTVGAFGSPTAGNSHSQGGTVNQGGFGSVEGKGNGGHSGSAARVVAAGFSVAPLSEPRAVSTRIAQPPTQPVILSEPAADYSEQAKAARIQGTVDIRVKFKVDGSIEVLEIVHGLPGLNDSALAVARGIRFRPPASDYITLIHVRFELVD